MRDNMEKVLERDARLGDLEDKSSTRPLPEFQLPLMPWTALQPRWLMERLGSSPTRASSSAKCGGRTPRYRLVLAAHGCQCTGLNGCRFCSSC